MPVFPLQSEIGFYEAKSQCSFRRFFESDRRCELEHIRYQKRKHGAQIQLPEMRFPFGSVTAGS